MICSLERQIHYEKAIYPGSFDPLTLGHIDIIKRASNIVDELVVGVLNNSAKNSLFSLDERVSMIEEMTKDLPNVSVTSFDGLLVEHMKADWRYHYCAWSACSDRF